MANNLVLAISFGFKLNSNHQFFLTGTLNGCMNPALKGKD